MNSMLNILDKILEDMPDILKSNLDDWLAIKIESQPTLDRLMKPVTVGKETFDICLHRSYSIKSTLGPQPHTHPCQAAMYIAKGLYRLEMGWGKEKFNSVGTIILNEGCKYEMVQPDAWHHFVPLSDYTLTIMIAGRTHGMKLLGQPEMQHKNLNENEAQLLLNEFRNLEW